ncbi:hypothetical protein SLS62_002763 [Diatrype stigma]|uniref:Uncharacterized protein n=1 Tax=Diatrype stigma TaxID=117547 RepID=A0AAN9V831_9PEZI
MAEASKSTASYSTDPALWVYTSLTAGSSHIVTATSRLETILRANRVPFKAVDIAVDEKARMLWGRRAGKDENGRVRKLPGLVQMGLVLGDLVEIEEWNEYGEVRQHVKIYYDDHTIPTKAEAAKLPNKMGGKPGMFGKPGAEPVQPPASSGTLAAAASGTGAAPPPAAPPLPEADTKKPAGTAAAPSKKPAAADGAKKPAAAAAAAATGAPNKSIAEEAAQRAKKVQLEALRKKVHGDKDKNAAAAENKAAATESPVDSVASGMKSLEISAPPPAAGKVAGEGGSGAASSSSQRSGSAVEEAPGETISAVEKAEATPEASSSEEESSEEEEDKASGDNKQAQAPAQTKK